MTLKQAKDIIDFYKAECELHKEIPTFSGLLSSAQVLRAEYESWKDSVDEDTRKVHRLFTLFAEWVDSRVEQMLLKQEHKGYNYGVALNMLTHNRTMSTANLVQAKASTTKRLDMTKLELRSGFSFTNNKS